MWIRATYFGSKGITLRSATRRFSTPLTRKSGLTQAPLSSFFPILTVPRQVVSALQLQNLNVPWLVGRLKEERVEYLEPHWNLKRGRIECSGLARCGKGEEKPETYCTCAMMRKYFQHSETTAAGQQEFCPSPRQHTQMSSSDLLAGHPIILTVFCLKIGASRYSSIFLMASIITLRSYGCESRFGSNLGASWIDCWISGVL